MERTYTMLVGMMSRLNGLHRDMEQVERFEKSILEKAPEHEEIDLDVLAACWSMS